MDCPPGYTRATIWDTDADGIPDAYTHLACDAAVDPTQYTFGGDAIVRTTLARDASWRCALCGALLVEESGAP